MRILYSFPGVVGRSGIGVTAQQQIVGLHRSGVELTVVCGAIEGALPTGVEVVTPLPSTVRRGLHKGLGVRRGAYVHDRLVSRMLRKRPRWELIHAWPEAALDTARVGARCGIPTVLEAPNTHTSHALDVVERLHRQLDVRLGSRHTHAASAARLERAEAEYRTVAAVLAPSEFARATFIERGIPAERVLLHRYGYDETVHAPVAPSDVQTTGAPRFVFVGRVEPRKGLHLLGEAWERAGIGSRAQLSIAGAIVPGYETVLAPLLDRETVHHLGFIDDVHELMRRSDVLVLPSLEEGSALVTYEAQSAGCALIVSDATGARCTHGVQGLVHQSGDVATLAEHLAQVVDDADLRQRLRVGAATHAPVLTWTRAAAELVERYEQVVATWPR